MGMEFIESDDRLLQENSALRIELSKALHRLAARDTMLPKDNVIWTEIKYNGITVSVAFKKVPGERAENYRSAEL